MDHCRFDVQYFLTILGDDNLQLITEQTNLISVKKGIENNRIIPPISEQEIRQWLGIHLHKHMSVVNMPNTRLHWNLSLRN